MRQSHRIQACSRREFLLRAAALPALTSIPFAAALGEENHHSPPYLALQKFILPGQDEFAEEKTAMEIREALSIALRTSELPVSSTLEGSSPCPATHQNVAFDLRSAVFDKSDKDIREGWKSWVQSLGNIRRAQFYPLPDGIIRYEVASERNGVLLHRVGTWKQTWAAGKLSAFSPVEEHVASAPQPLFRDVTAATFAHVPSFEQQLTRGVPYWRARLDPATGIDIYGSNGIAVGDIDNDGTDELYVCQPGGLPNRLYKFSLDGTLRDLTETWGVGLLDDTSTALFLDLRNTGRQDLVVLKSNGPVLFLNDGHRFSIQPDAFHFATAPAGGFTGMAAADFDRDGKLDLYLCCYVYFQSEAQYTYASPYHDAQNGPPNFLFRNRLNRDGSGFFDDCTAETGMNENNNRFSFAPAWCDFNEDGWPDLYVANDFGRKNLYVNSKGRFHDAAKAAGVEDIGPGMSACWFDYDHDGRADLYVANMWTDAGQRVVNDPNFAPARGKTEREAYRGHTKGNSLYRNRGDGAFDDMTSQQHVSFGRWAWSSGGHDLDNDGNPEIFVTCGMLTNESTTDLMSFFWRQVVARSPVTATPSAAYQNGWNAINQFIREEYSWSGHEPNVLHVRRGDRYFDFSGVSGLDFAEDSRAFAITDFDGDGRPDVILKSRLGPQVRILQNNCAGVNHAISFRLQGTQSNRDAIGAKIQADGQTKWLDAGSGFLSQHSKRLLFGLGDSAAVKRIRITWPSGAVQEFADLPAGRTYSIVEGSPDVTSKPFREQKKLHSGPVQADNELRLQDTWFPDPVPLPEKQRGPGLFVIRDASPVNQIFRRYLFDWRTTLTPPLAFLLNDTGSAVKVYAQIPTEQQINADLARIEEHSKLALPFAGDYISQPHRDFFKFGVAYLWSGYPEQALPYLEAVLRRTPSNARVLVLVGQIQIGFEHFESAEGYFRRALQADTKSPEAAYGLGLALARQNRFDEARGYLEQAIAERPDYADAINDLGTLYIQQGKTNDAIAAFQYGIRSAPDEDILYLNLGRTYARLGQIEKAREVMQQLLDRKPDSAVARHALEELSGR